MVFCPQPYTRNPQLKSPEVASAQRPCEAKTSLSAASSRFSKTEAHPFDLRFTELRDSKMASVALIGFKGLVGVIGLTGRVYRTKVGLSDNSSRFRRPYKVCRVCGEFKVGRASRA